MRSIIVGCGKAKRDEPSRARNMYTSSYFEKKYMAAQRLDGDVYILSAKYGLLCPDEQIAPYDTTLHDLDSDEQQELSERVSNYLGKYDEVVVLAGEQYRNLIEHDNMTSPFEDTSGIGEQMVVLEEL